MIHLCWAVSEIFVEVAEGLGQDSETILVPWHRKLNQNLNNYNIETHNSEVK